MRRPMSARPVWFLRRNNQLSRPIKNLKNGGSHQSDAKHVGLGDGVLRRENVSSRVSDLYKHREKVKSDNCWSLA